MAKHQRKMVNMLLQPLVQLRIGFVNVSLSVLFVILLGTYVYGKLIQFTEVVATLTEADEAVTSLLGSYLGNVGWTALAAALGFILVNMFASVYMTHKLVGPTIAFRRHIRALMDGNFGVKTKLRTGDAFSEVADDLNKLSDRLQETIRDTPA